MFSSGSNSEDKTLLQEGLNFILRSRPKKLDDFTEEERKHIHRVFNSEAKGFLHTPHPSESTLYYTETSLKIKLMRDIYLALKKFNKLTYENYFKQATTNYVKNQTISQYITAIVTFGWAASNRQTKANGRELPEEKISDTNSKGALLAFLLGNGGTNDESLKGNFIKLLLENKEYSETIEGMLTVSLKMDEIINAFIFMLRSNNVIPLAYHTSTKAVERKQEDTRLSL